MANKQTKKAWRAGIEIISETTVQDGFANGRKEKSVLFRLAGKKFKVNIRSDSHAFQSHAALLQWTDEKGFVLVTSKNPVRDFGIDIAYKQGISPSIYDPILEDLVGIAKAFVD